MLIFKPWQRNLLRQNSLKRKSYLYREEVFVAKTPDDGSPNLKQGKTQAKSASGKKKIATPKLDLSDEVTVASPKLAKKTPAKSNAKNTEQNRESGKPVTPKQKTPKISPRVTRSVAKKRKSVM